MKYTVWLIGAALLALHPGELRAQANDEPRAGRVEVGGFGQFTAFGNRAGCPCFRPEDAFGGGGRIGLVVSPPIGIELDATFASPAVMLGDGSMSYNAIAARLVYALPFEFLPTGTTALLGAGPVRTAYSHPGHSETAWGASGLAGVRVHLSGPVALRVDGVLDYVAATESHVNFGVRAGLSVLFDTRPAPVPPTVAVVPAPPPAPAAPEPPPPAEPAPAPGLSEADLAVLKQPVYFDFDRAEIRPDAANALQRKARVLLDNPGVRLVIEGHADERGTRAYNIGLGDERAAAVRSFLAAAGVSADRLTTTSFGEERHACATQPKTEECHQLNRRAEFVVR